MAIAQNQLWGIILAGGSGKRLLDFTNRLYGHPRPKQYCVFTGTRSMLERTLDRARLLISPDRLLTVILQAHRKYIEEINYDQPSETFVVQPECRDTGPGLLLPLLKIHHMAPKSVVVVLPSDHFILGEKSFMKSVKQASEFVESYPWSIVLIGVKAQRSEAEYGWIEPGTELIPYRGAVFSPVASFFEKPSPAIAEVLRSSGCLWNTFVQIGKTSTFLMHIKKSMPEVFSVFQAIREVFNTSREEEAIKRAYRSIPPANFSSSVLERVCNQLYVLEALNIYWSDWGNEDRIRHDLDQFDLRLSCP